MPRAAPQKRARAPRRPPPVYQVELVSMPALTPDLVGRLEMLVFGPPPKPVPVRVQLHALKVEIGYCQACRFTPGADELTRALHVHHVLPRAKGGTHERENLLVLCARCHALAHAAFKKRKATRRRVLVRLVMMHQKEIADGSR